MSYITSTDLENAVGKDELRLMTTDDPNASVPTTAIVDSAIARAEAYVNGYLRNRYVVPIADGTVPEDIKDATQAIALHLLSKRFGLSSNLERYVFDYNEAVKYLTLIANGKVDLDVEVQSARTDVRVIRTNAEDRTPYFDDETLEKY